MHKSRGNTPSMPGVTWPMHQLHSKSKCIVSDSVTAYQISSHIGIVEEIIMFLSNLITAVGLFLHFLLTGRETCCCGEMGKCNYTNLHLIWLSCSQNHLVPVFWDTTYVSIPAYKCENVNFSPAAADLQFV